MAFECVGSNPTYPTKFKTFRLILFCIKKLKLLNKAGIYKIFINDWIYIGSTTRSFKERFKEHRNKLKSKTHCNPILQNLYNKYKTLSFEIIEIISDNTTIIYREQFYIDNLNPNINICKTASSTLNKRHTTETKLKIKEAVLLQGKVKRDKLGLELSEKTIRKHAGIRLTLKNIIQYTLQGKFIKLWENSKKIQEELNVNPKQINSACRGDHKTCIGFLWRYLIPNTDFTLDLEIESKIKVTRKYCNGLFCKKCNEPLVIQQKYFCSRKCRGEFYRIK